MTRTEAERLRERIEAEDSMLQTSLRYWEEDRNWEIHVVDERRGGTFIVRSEEDWESRKREAKLTQAMIEMWEEESNG